LTPNIRREIIVDHERFKKIPFSKASKTTQVDSDEMNADAARDWMLTIIEDLEKEGVTVTNREELLSQAEWFSGQLNESGMARVEVVWENPEETRARLELTIPDEEEQRIQKFLIQNEGDPTASALADAMASGDILELDDSFEYSCIHCGNCCNHLEEMVLRPYDLWQLLRATQLPAVEFINRYCNLHVGGNSHMPVLTMAPVGEDHVCPLFNETTMACLYPQHKPYTCRIYPLGRMTEIDKEDSSKVELKYFLPPNRCEHKQDGAEKHTVRDWIVGSEEHDQANHQFNLLTIAFEKAGATRNMGMRIPFLAHFFYHADEPIIPLSADEKIPLEQGIASRLRFIDDLLNLSEQSDKITKEILDTMLTLEKALGADPSEDESFNAFKYLADTLCGAWELCTGNFAFGSPSEELEDARKGGLSMIRIIDSGRRQALLAENLGNLELDPIDHD
jgi:Fe-S-cluster containining protein